MGLGGAAGAAGAAWLVLFFAGFNGLALACVGGFASLDARDGFIRSGMAHVRWRRRLSRIFLPFVVLGLWLATAVAFAFGGDRVGFGWTVFPVFAGSLLICRYLARWLRRAEFMIAPAAQT